MDAETQPPAPAPRAGRPWSPTAVAVLTLFLSPLVGGVLHGLNYGKLDQRGYRRFALARNLLAGALLILLAAMGIEQPFGLSLFFASYFYKTQEESFQHHLSQGGKKGSPFFAILLAILVSIPVLLVAFGLQ